MPVINQVNPTLSFLYKWYDRELNKFYIGSHKGSLDDGYVCSSKYMLEEYKKRPDDFSRQILVIGDLDYIRRIEVDYLKSLNVKYDHNFYNMTNGDSKFYNKGHSEEAKRKMSLAAKLRKRSPMTKEWCDNISKGRKKKKIRLSEDHKNKIREKSRGRIVSLETRLKMSLSQKSRKRLSEDKWSNEWKRKMLIKTKWGFPARRGSSEHVRRMQESRKLNKIASH